MVEGKKEKEGLFEVDITKGLKSVITHKNAKLKAFCNI